MSHPAAPVTLLVGDIAVMEDLPTADPPGMKQNVALTVAEGSIYLALDQLAKPSPGISGTANNPLQDVRMREALSLASNRKAIVGRVMDAVAVAAAVHQEPRCAPAQRLSGRRGNSTGAVPTVLRSLVGRRDPSTGAANGGHKANAELGAQLDEAASMMDDGARRALLRKVDELVLSSCRCTSRYRSGQSARGWAMMRGRIR